ncbi:MAG: VapC toxin family PIN domain ribonuclease [Armatimonadetes bacterium CG07_land_8_20_14_0_80_59_28]|nr:MAG: VapC toxin family PIN domain ribonuclease [Armatimonadetes bacterium CG07_land_8_20_14_0_80_59_28]PIY48411.1 MAG: VapC toxin family PIN domain ribonuclease [Armatimonadetes bacterium CG_4_10_14_3_um_filter_59_10]
MSSGSSLFVDTAGWAAYYDAGEVQHQDAKLLYKLALSEERGIVTTNFVITEVVGLFTSRLRVPRQTTIAFIDQLKNTSYIEIVHISPLLDDQAWELLKSRPDKDWSLVDCASFVVMRQRGITEALTTDHHCEQAGFARLLR